MNKASNEQGGTSLRRFKPYPTYKDSGVEWLGEIPAHWGVKRLKHLLRLHKGAIKTGPFGSQLQSSEMLAGDIKVYNQRSVLDRDFATGENYISLQKFEELRSFETFPGDLLITTRGSIGRCAVLPPDAERGILHPCLMRIQVDQREISTRFLEVLIQDCGIVLDQLRLMSNATTIDVIYSESLKEVSIVVPPSKDQDAILVFLDRETARIDALVTKKERLIEMLQEKRTALITRAVTKGLDPNVPMKDSGVEWLGKIPAHWEVKRLKRIAEFRGGGTPSKDNLEYWRGEIPWVSPKDMKVSVVVDTEDKITAQAVRESATKLVPAGSVLLVVRSGILVHSIPVAIAGREVTLNQDLKALIPSSEFVPEYLMYLFSGLQRELLVEWKKEGATVESLELELVKSTPTPLPSQSEQHAIAAFLDRETARIDTLVAKVRAAIDRLRELRTALISAAVTGKIDVREEAAL
jgi:type I restriction enzyme S subunit